MATAAILLAVAIDPRNGATAATEPRDNGETVVEHEVAEIERAGVHDIVVVLGPDAEQIIPLVARDNVEPIIDARFSAGVACSLRVGASAVPRGTTIALLASVAHPAGSDTYAGLLAAHASRPSPLIRITGHSWPSLVDAAMLAALRNLPDGATIEEFLDRHAAHTIDGR